MKFNIGVEIWSHDLMLKLKLKFEIQNGNLSLIWSKFFKSYSELYFEVDIEGGNLKLKSKMKFSSFTKLAIFVSKIFVPIQKQNSAWIFVSFRSGSYWAFPGLGPGSKNVCCILR